MLIIFKSLGKNGSSILFSGGILFLLIGYLGINENAVIAGWILIILGFAIEWLLITFRFILNLLSARISRES